MGQNADNSIQQEENADGEENVGDAAQGEGGDVDLSNESNTNQNEEQQQGEETDESDDLGVDLDSVELEDTEAVTDAVAEALGVEDSTIVLE